MGDILQSNCSCGYESEELYLGGGMMDYGEICNVPYYCENCEIVGTINIKKKNSDDLSKTAVKKDIKCKKCKRKVQYYGEIEKDTFDYQEGSVFDWNIGNKRYSLPDKPHYCPKCKKENLQFYSIGCWD